MISCLIVEDEPLAAEILQDYVRQIPFLKLIGTCSDAIYALEVLQRDSVDLLLLDIHLPGLKGLDFLKSLPNPPKVILTTAYQEYALQGYELNVVDYLLKPIEFDRFLLAINKVKGLTTALQKKETIAVQSKGKKAIIPTGEIIYIESQKEYIKIQTMDSSYTSKYALRKIEEELSPLAFLRVHRSFIVALDKIKAFNGHEIELPGKLIPIGGDYRAIVQARLKDFFG